MKRRACWPGGVKVVVAAVLTVVGLAVNPEDNRASGAEPALLAQAAPANPAPAAAQPAAQPAPPAPDHAVALPTAPTPVPGTAPGVAVPAPAPDAATTGGYSYDPSGRRDPFAATIREGQGTGKENLDLPPLERVSLTELNLIGIVWGGFGYSAMVQAPDGKGYTVRRGTRIGPNNGVVGSITESSVTVEEHFIDVYGNKQVREYVKHLHEKESSP